MPVPKTTKGLLKLLIAIAEDGVEVLADPKLTPQEHYAVGSMLAGLQNDLGENTELLEKYNLKYNG